MRIEILWHMTLCCSADSHERSGVTCCYHLTVAASCLEKLCNYSKRRVPHFSTTGVIVSHPNEFELQFVIAKNFYPSTPQGSIWTSTSGLD